MSRFDLLLIILVPLFSGDIQNATSLDSSFVSWSSVGYTVHVYQPVENRRKCTNNNITHKTTVRRYPANICI